MDKQKEVFKKVMKKGMAIIRDKVMNIYLNKYLITFMDDGEGFLTAER